MPRLSRSLIQAGAVAASLAFSPVVADVAAAAPAVARAAPAVAPAAPAVATRYADDPLPGTGDGSMPGMGDGSMPGMSHDSMPGMGDGSMPGMSHGSTPGMTPGPAGSSGSNPHDSMANMPGMADDHENAAPTSRPLAWVAGAFVVVNGLVMAVAAVLRRRTPARPALRGRRLPADVRP